MSFYLYDDKEIRCGACHKPCRRVNSDKGTLRTVHGKTKASHTMSDCCSAAVYTGYELNLNQAYDGSAVGGFVSEALHG